jgi:CRISPR-associated protein Cas2
MVLTILITRDVEDRYRGFLASAMLEMAPGVYASPYLGARSRDQIWRSASGTPNCSEAPSS